MVTGLRYIQNIQISNSPPSSVCAWANHLKSLGLIFLISQGWGWIWWVSRTVPDLILIHLAEFWERNSQILSHSFTVTTLLKLWFIIILFSSSWLSVETLVFLGIYNGFSLSFPTNSIAAPWFINNSKKILPLQYTINKYVWNAEWMFPRKENLLLPPKGLRFTRATPGWKGEKAEKKMCTLTSGY